MRITEISSQMLDHFEQSHKKQGHTEKEISMNPILYELEFVWTQELEGGETEMSSLAEISSATIPRVGDSIEFDLPDMLDEEELPVTWVVIDVRFQVVQNEGKPELSNKVTLFVDIPLDEDEE